MFAVGRKAWLLLLMVPLLTGCGQNPFLTPQQQAAWQQQQQAYAAQLAETRRRASQLDNNNEGLHAQIAQARQQVEVYREQVDLLREQLRETSDQLRETQLARQQAEKQMQTMEASTRRRGSATLRANNSVAKTLQPLNLPGLKVRQDGDVVRVELPADQLFRPGSAQLQASSTQLLSQVARAVSANYPQQRIAIEGHTDSGPAVAGSSVTHHQLSAQQAMAVFDALTRVNRLPARQLFVLAHGANYPRASNATAAGRAANRRVELVIYPESI